MFVTGRGLESVLPLLSDPGIPEPDYIICDVGCTIVDGKTLQPVQPIQAEIDDIWPGTQLIESELAHLPGLRRQDVPQERRCSFFCDGAAVTDALRAIVDDLSCDLLYSAGHYLDVLPPGINKGKTLSELVSLLELDPACVMVAGDTLNDLSMYQHQFKGVCVGDSEAELIRQTQGQSKVLHAQEPGCGGILAAIEHFGFLGRYGQEAETADLAVPGKSELVIVYHRLPYEESVENGKLLRRSPSSPNGILPTLLGFFAEGRRGSWVAWSNHKNGEHFETHTEVDKSRYPKLTAARVHLQKDEVDVFYRSFSKEAFWPTLHTFWERASFREDHWEVYLEVNKKFAERTAEEAAEGAVVWIHDYNLWMVPAFLREIRPDLKIAFFHHTYFPSADVFNVLPWRKEIVGSLLQCDYIGFHIPRQSENFVDVVRGVTPFKVLEKVSCAPRFLTFGCAVGLEEMTSQIEVNGRKISLGAHPVGLGMERVKESLDNAEIQSRIAELRAEFSQSKVVLSVERLDFTKGILEKLEAYERLLGEHPELIANVTLVTVCVPAAREMSIYDELQRQIEQAVGRINGAYARPGWTPIHFFFRSLPFQELVAYYAIADVMWITPLRDGLNLVAKEYVATQGLMDGKGVLVLSEFAGAAAELRGAVLANPHDPKELVSSCYFALTMHPQEAKTRLREAFDVVEFYDVAYWGKEFLMAVSEDKSNVTALDDKRCAVA